MRSTKKIAKNEQPGYSGFIKRSLIAITYYLLVGYRCYMVALISLAPISITVFTILDKYSIRGNKHLDEYSNLEIVFSLLWIPVYIHFGNSIKNRLLRYCSENRLKFNL